MHPKKTLGEAGPLTRFFAKGASLELGKMALILGLCGDQAWSGMRLIAMLKEWLAEHGYSSLLEPAAAEQIAKLAKMFRNPAAHAENLARQQALEAKRLTFERLKRICPSDESYI